MYYIVEGVIFNYSIYYSLLPTQPFELAVIFLEGKQLERESYREAEFNMWH